MMTAADDMKLLVLTPETVLVEQAVCKVSLPGSAGRFTVLRNHAPLISSLEEGEVVYASGGVEAGIHIRSGFVEVNANAITVCAEL